MIPLETFYKTMFGSQKIFSKEEKLFYHIWLYCEKYKK